MPSALCHVAVENFAEINQLYIGRKLLFRCTINHLSCVSLTVKCAKVICCPALGYFLYDYEIDLNLTPSLRHFYFTVAQTMFTLTMKRAFSCGQLKLFRLRSLFHWLIQNDRVLKLSDTPFCGA